MVREQLAEIAWNGFSSGFKSVRKDDLSKRSCFEQMTKCGLLKSEMEEFAWLHFSFRDYSAAEHICSDRLKGDLLAKLQRCLLLENHTMFFGFVFSFVSLSSSASAAATASATAPSATAAVAAGSASASPQLPSSHRTADAFSSVWSVSSFSGDRSVRDLMLEDCAVKSSLNFLR